MIATVASLSSGTAWDISDERNYDVWGGVRQGSAAGGPKGRYVANLGHVQDDESGLVYMRARYYEPESGRFISEDRMGSGENWYLYANSNPIAKVDSSGNNDEVAQATGALLVWWGVTLMMVGVGMFAVGLKNFYAGLSQAQLGLVQKNYGIAGGGRNLGMGAALSVWSALTMMGGANSVVRGALYAYAGKLLMALGEDGWEFASTCLIAASPVTFLSGAPGFFEDNFGNPLDWTER